MKQLPPRGSMMLVKNFDEESVKELPDLMSKLLSQFREDSIERLEWTHVFDRYAPQSKFGSLFYELKRRACLITLLLGYICIILRYVSEGTVPTLLRCSLLCPLEPHFLTKQE